MIIDPVRLRAADIRLQRTYGITLAEYEIRFKEQGGVCAICLRPPFKFRLSVDHDHRFDRTEITLTRREDGQYQGYSIGPDGLMYSHIGPVKTEVRLVIKLQLRRVSVRGLLCFQCNKGMAYYRDVPERFERAALYLRSFNFPKKGLDKVPVLLA